MKSYGKDSKESWVVAVACSMIFLLATLPVRLGGQLFVSMLDRYNTNRKAASFPFALAYCMRSVSGPLAGYFANKFGHRIVVLVGGMFCVFGVGVCFFAENILTIDICLGVIYGTGFGISTALTPGIINAHFVKHKATANGIAFGGSGFGAFITPPLLEILLEHFGVSGAFLIIAAITLNIIPATMLILKPKEEPKTKSTAPFAVECVVHNNGNTFTSNGIFDHSKELPKQNHQNSSLTKHEDIASSEKFHEPQHKNITGISKSVSYSDNGNIDDACKSIAATDKIGNPIVPHQSVKFSLTKENMMNFFSPKSNGTPILINVSAIDHLSNSANKNGSVMANISKYNEKICNKRCSSLKSFSVLWSPLFLVATFITSSSYFAMNISWTIIIDVVRDKGVEKQYEVYYVMVMAISDMIGRFCLGWITDSGFMSRSNFTLFCFSMMSLFCLIIPFVYNSYLTMTLIFALSLMYGGNMTGLPGIIDEYFTEDQRAMAMASRLLIYTPMSFTMSPMIGYFRGTLGSYDGLFFTLTGLCAFSCVLIFFLPLLSRLNRKTKDVKKDLMTDGTENACVECNGC